MTAQPLNEPTPNQNRAAGGPQSGDAKSVPDGSGPANQEKLGTEAQIAAGAPSADLSKARAKPSPELLLSFLKDENPAVRKAASDKLATLGSEAARVIPDLHTAAREESNPLALRSMLRAMASIGKHAQPSMIYFTRCNDDYLRLDTIRVLSISGNPGTLALPALEHIFRNSSDDLSKVALTSLSRIYTKPLPANFAQGDVVRFASEWAKKLGPGAKSSPDGQDGIPVHALGPERLMRENLAKAIDSIYSKDDAAHKKAALYKGELALSKLQLSDTERTVVLSLLAFAMRDPDAGVREYATKCVRALKPSTEMLGVLVDVAVRDEERAADVAIAALRDERSNVTPAVKLLAAMANREDSEARARALAAIGKLAYHATPEIMQTFKSALRSEDEDVRRSAAQGLYSIQPWYVRGAMETFVSMLNSPDPVLCKTALSSFSEFLFFAGNEEKLKGLALLEQTIKRKGPDPDSQLTSRQEQIVRAASVIAAGYLVVNSDAELQKQTLGLLAYASQDMSHMETRRAAYSGIFTIGRQTKDQEVLEIARQALEWSQEDETERDMRELIGTYLQRLDPDA